MLSNVQSTISSVISGVGNLVLLYVGIMQVINNNMTLGSFMAFNTLAGYFMDPIGNLVSLQLSIQEANISMKRLSEIMDYEREQKSDAPEECGKEERHIVEDAAINMHDIIGKIEDEWRGIHRTGKQKIVHEKSGSTMTQNR